MSGIFKRISIIFIIVVFAAFLSSCSMNKSKAVDIDMYSVSDEELQDAGLTILKTEGKGMLLEKDGQKILILSGTHYEMGFQHGILLKDDIQILIKEVIRQSEIIKPGFLEKAWNTAEKHIPERFKEEMKGLADGSGLTLEEVQYANIFPELFHCSGIVLYGDATENGEFMHARVLDYMTDYGLQDYAIVIIARPDNYNTYINAIMTGIIGCVTGMNNQQVVIGEMGGGGEEKWNGIPMTFLMKKALEESNTLGEAVSTFRRNKRTCEYYYLISDVKSKDARILYCTPQLFITLKPGQNHPQLPAPQIKDTLVVSGEERYLHAQEKINEFYGQIDKDVFIEILKRPVSMKENLHNAIFLPEELTMWLANASSDITGPDYQACYQEYHEYDIPLLLKFYKHNFKNTN
jgi:isopenicillin-N N-acyltransferase like protein